jgi:hypothetical protein
LYHEVIGQTEPYNRLGWDFDIAVSGQAADCGSCTGTDEAADEQPYAAGSYTAYKHSESAAAADDCGGSLSFTFFGSRQIGCIEAVSGAVQCQVGEAQLQDRSAFEVSSFVGLDDYAGHGRSARNYYTSIASGDRFFDLSIKSVSGAACLYADVLIDADRQRRSGCDIYIRGPHDGCATGSGRGNGLA